MVDENQTNPTPVVNNATTQPAPTNDSVQTVVANVESSLEKRIKNWLSDVYSQNKFLFYTVIPLMGIVYVVVKYHNLLINFLIGNSKNILQQAQTQDQQLQQQADATKQQADNLVNQANNLQNQQPPIDDDWDQQ